MDTSSSQYHDETFFHSVVFLNRPALNTHEVVSVFSLFTVNDNDRKITYLQLTKICRELRNEQDIDCDTLFFDAEYCYYDNSKISDAQISLFTA